LHHDREVSCTGVSGAGTESASRSVSPSRSGAWRYRAGGSAAATSRP